MKILFVAPLDNEGNIHNWGAPSLAIVRIVSYLKHHLQDNDIEYLIYENQIDDFDPIEKWQNDKIELCGISTLHYTNVATFEFVQRWRKTHPESFIFIGGNEAGANYQDIFDKCPIDAAVTAEGEDTTLDLIKWKFGEKKFEEINGIVYRKYAKPITEDKFWEYWRYVDFSQFRYPKFWEKTAALFDHPNYAEIYCIRLTPSSHCQRSCTFCSLNFVRNIACGRSTPPVSLQGWQIMQLIHNIKQQLPDTRTLYFCGDDIFYPNRRYFEDFVELYEKSGYDYRILVQTSSYSLQENDFRLLQRIGCVHISVGVENVSKSVQRSLKKPQDMEKIERIIELSKQYGIKIYYLIILIPPASTMEDLRLNYETITRWIDQGVGISIMPVIYAYRGMPLFEDNHYQIQYQTKQIADTKQIYNDPYYVLPNDPKVRALTLEFIEREWDYVNKAYEDKDNKLKFKGGTAPLLLKLLGELLEKYNYNDVSEFYPAAVQER